jgi:hypothetical protein
MTMRSFDSLEQFIADNWQALDRAELPQGLWAVIGKQLDRGDALERKVVAHRAAFDTHEPPTQVWAAIEKRLNPQQKRASSISLGYFLRVAAAVLLLFGTGGAAGYFLGRQQQPEPTGMAADLPQGAHQAETVWLQRIEKLTEELNSFDEGQEVVVRLTRSDAGFQQLKQAIGDAPPHLRPALIQKNLDLYRQRVDILERALEQHRRYKPELRPKNL